MNERAKRVLQAIAESELEDRVAKAIFDAQHKGLSNCLDWDDSDLDRAGNRDFYLMAARAAIAALAEKERK